MNQENNKNNVITELEGKIDVTTLGNFRMVGNYKVYDSVKFIKPDGEVVTIDNLAVNKKFIGEFNHYTSYLKIVDFRKINKVHSYNMVSQFKAQKKLFTDDLVQFQLKINKNSNMIASAFLAIGSIAAYSTLGPYSLLVMGAAGYFTSKTLKVSNIEKEHNKSLLPNDISQFQLIKESFEETKDTNKNKMKR